MKRQKNIGNKGFSLVELIIVIAIMAILVGVMAPQLLKYVERSRQSSDAQLADTVRTAVLTALLDPAVDDAPSPFTGTLDDLLGTTTSSSSPKFVAAVTETLNGQSADAVQAQLKSNAYKDSDIDIEITSGTVTVTIASSDTDVEDITIPQVTTSSGAGG
jgi:type IV pilus assembly protein PilA